MSYETHQSPPFCIMVPVAALSEATGLTRAQIMGWATSPEDCPAEIDAWVTGFTKSCKQPMQTDAALREYARRNPPPVKLAAWFVTSVDGYFEGEIINAQSSKAAAEIALWRHMGTVGEGQPITRLIWSRPQEAGGGGFEMFHITLCKDAATERGQSELVGYASVCVGPPPRDELRTE